VVQARRRERDGEQDRPARVGFTVSKQVGNAVERNRVRRRLREIVRLTGCGALQAGHDYVLIGRRSALALPFGEMRRELDVALDRIRTGEAKPAGTGGQRPRPPHEQGSPGRRGQKPGLQPNRKPSR
jgi:ribonuclease P protein component